jgi:hypothetical protein
MKSAMEIKIDSTILGRIHAARMSNAERELALSAMRNADLLVDGFVWIAKKIEQFGERLFLKLPTKHHA